MTSSLYCELSEEQLAEIVSNSLRTKNLEFSAIQWTHSEDSFWIGYGRRISYDYADCIRRGIYNLLTRLWNAYVYLCEYNQYDNAISEREEAVRQMIDLKNLLG